MTSTLNLLRRAIATLLTVILGVSLATASVAPASAAKGLTTGEIHLTGQTYTWPSRDLRLYAWNNSDNKNEGYTEIGSQSNINGVKRFVELSPEKQYFWSVTQQQTSAPYAISTLFAGTIVAFTSAESATKAQSELDAIPTIAVRPNHAITIDTYGAVPPVEVELSSFTVNLTLPQFNVNEYVYSVDLYAMRSTSLSSVYTAKNTGKNKWTFTGVLPNEDFYLYISGSELLTYFGGAHTSAYWASSSLITESSTKIRLAPGTDTSTSVTLKSKYEGAPNITFNYTLPHGVSIADIAFGLKYQISGNSYQSSVRYSHVTANTDSMTFHGVLNKDYTADPDGYKHMFLAVAVSGRGIQESFYGSSRTTSFDVNSAVSLVADASTSVVTLTNRTITGELVRVPHGYLNIDVYAPVRYLNSYSSYSSYSSSAPGGYDTILIPANSFDSSDVDFSDVMNTSISEEIDLRSGDNSTFYLEDLTTEYVPMVWFGSDDENGVVVNGKTILIAPDMDEDDFLASLAAEIAKAKRIKAVDGKDLSLPYMSFGGVTEPKYFLRSITKPSISGKAQVGATLTVSTGTWDPHSVSHEYQWFANGTPIPNATTSKLVVTSALAGKKISAKVTARFRGFRSSTQDATGSLDIPAPVTAKPAAPKIESKTLPKISGVATVAKTLTATAPQWNVSGVTTRYQWLVNGIAIKGSTKSTLKLLPEHVGKTITVRATGSKPGSVSAVVTSAQTLRVSKSTTTISAKLAKTSIKKSKSTTITVKLKAPGTSKPTGTVTVKVGKKSVKAKLKATHKGVIKVKLNGSKLNLGKKQKVSVSFKPSGTTAKASTSSKAVSAGKLTVR